MSSDYVRPRLDGQRFEVAIIGGGVNGAAIARECARAGRRTLLVEQADFASGTTSRSTRIIHGGLRYLEHGELGLVRESLRERERLLQQKSHLVRPMRFAVALPPGARRNPTAIRAGLWLYRSMGHCDDRCSSNLASLEQALDSGQRWALFDYEDAQCEFPERLVAEWVCEATGAGAVVRNYCEALEVTVRDGDVRGLVLRDLLTGAEDHVDASVVINASGPWVDAICRNSRIDAPRMIGGLRGSHIVLPRFPGAPESAVYTEAADGRAIFVIPWNGQILVGSTEVEDDADPSLTEPSADEVSYLLSSVQALFPGAGLTSDDIAFTFAGVRALPYSPGKRGAAITRRSLLRDHADDGAAGLISVIGGKLTTAASLARKCARTIGIKVPEPAVAMVAPGPKNGFDSTMRHWARQIAAVARIPEASARAIAELHGPRALCIARSAEYNEKLRVTLCPHTDHIVAEAISAASYEHAVTLGDIVLRRVPVALGACWSSECSRDAAARIGAALGWSEARMEMALERLEEERGRFLRKPGSAGRVPVGAKRMA